MTGYFAFPASPELESASHQLLDNFEKGVKEPQNTLFIRVAQLYSDEIVDALLLNLVHAPESSGTAAKVLDKFAGLIKGTVHALIRQVLGKLDNKEMQPLSSIIRDRRIRLVHEGVERDHISFPMPADFFTEFRSVMAAGANGERQSERMTAAMLKFADLSFHYFYEESTKPLKLGFVARKMVDVGGAAISKGSHSAIKSLIPGMNEAELKAFAAYFGTMLAEV